ncbi:hypothetical protein GQ53DRAFT_184200, partial [Thozetella sp. PMI_491]
MAAFTHADIAEVARMHRADGCTPSFRHGTATKPLSGKQCMIYSLGFPNGDSWAVRIPSLMRHLPAAAIANYVEAEARILKDLEAAGFTFSPKLLGYSTAFDNPIGFPYLVLTWIEGRPLEWTSAVPARRDVRDKILRQMADVLLELALRTCIEENGPESTVAAFLTGLIDRKILRVVHGNLLGVELHSCLLERALVSQAVQDALGGSMFALSHEDLAPQNIIVDGENNIKGIIDWGLARRLPVQLAVRFPRFLAIEPPDLTEPPPQDVNEFSSVFLQPPPSLQVDRLRLISHITGKSELSNDSKCLALRRSMASVLSNADSDWRDLFFEAACS